MSEKLEQEVETQNVSIIEGIMQKSKYSKND